MFGRKTIVDGHDRQARAIADFGADVVMAVQSAEHESSAMEIDQHRPVGRPRLAVEPARHAPDRLVLCGHALRARLAEVRAIPVIEGPLLGHGEVNRVVRIEAGPGNHETPDARILQL